MAAGKSPSKTGATRHPIMAKLKRSIQDGGKYTEDKKVRRGVLVR
jgi:hypothetical protein